MLVGSRSHLGGGSGATVPGGLSGTAAPLALAGGFAQRGGSTTRLVLMGFQARPATLRVAKGSSGDTSVEREGARQLPGGCQSGTAAPQAQPRTPVRPERGYNQVGASGVPSHLRGGALAFSRTLVESHFALAGC
jgi:hypothetical protein